MPVHPPLTTSAVSPHACFVLRTVATALFASWSAFAADAQVATAPGPDRGSEILWDEWDAPHIYGGSLEELGWGFGWAQMRNHGNAILELYGLARGRAAEYWGADHLASDRFIRTMGVPEAGEAALAAQPPEFRAYLEAFAAGMNAFAAAHPEALSDERERALPVTAEDMLLHGYRLTLTFVALTGSDLPLLDMGGQPLPPGSNTWAIGPSRSATGEAMLLQNPHLPWTEPLMRLTEAHLVAPGLDVQGATLIGLPVIVFGFNDHLGWSHTINTVDVLDTYALHLQGGGYLLDGEVQPFTTEERVLRVRQPDGSMAQETLPVRRSVHGPVLSLPDGTALAVRIAVLSSQGALLQWWDMGRAQSLAEFEATLRQLQMPMFTVSYADREGHILMLFNGQVPVRAGGDFLTWQAPVPGDSSDLIWTDIHPYEALPRVVDPASGFVQNSNSPPWFATLPPAYAAADFPPELAPQFLLPREQRGLDLLSGDASITFDELIAMHHDDRMRLADMLLDDLLGAARGSNDPLVRDAARVLASWDREAGAESRGALLFAAWVERQCQGTILNWCDFAEPWSPEDPLSTPHGLADPQTAAEQLREAAAEVQSQFGGLDVPWGDVMRLTGALPGHGAPGEPLGVFHVLYFEAGSDGQFRPVDGDTWVAAIRFTPEGPKGEVLLAYGNRSGPEDAASPQVELLAREQMRPLLRVRAEVEAAAVDRTPIPDLSAQE